MVKLNFLLDQLLALLDETNLEPFLEHLIGLLLLDLLLESFLLLLSELLLPLQSFLNKFLFFPLVHAGSTLLILLVLFGLFLN